MRSGRNTAGSCLAVRAAVPAEQVQELPARFRAVGQEMRLRILAIRQTLARDRVALRVFLHFLGAQRIDLRTVQSEDLRAQRGRDLRVTVLSAQLRSDLERAERLDLVLRRAVPDRVRAPQHVVLAGVLEQLANAVCSRLGVAHQEAPGAAELGVDVRVRLDAVLDERAYERVDTVTLRIVVVRLLLHGRHESRVIDQERDVGEALRYNADVAALAMLVRLLAEGQALVHADHLDAERARFLDEADAGVVRQEEALAAWTELRIGLPRAYAPFLLQLVHALDITGLVRVDASVDHQPVRSLHLVDDAAHRVGGLTRHRLVIGARGDERQDHHVGVGVHEHVLDELFRRQAVQVAALAGLRRERTGGLRRPLERSRRRRLDPGAGRIDEMALHVEDELALSAGAPLRKLRVERGFRLDLEEAAGFARSRVRCVEREQRARRAAS